MTWGSAQTPITRSGAKAWRRRLFSRRNQMPEFEKTTVKTDGDVVRTSTITSTDTGSSTASAWWIGLIVVLAIGVGALVMSSNNKTATQQANTSQDQAVNAQR